MLNKHVVVKVWYSIGDVAKEIGEPTYNVRFYEDECEWTRTSKRNNRGEKRYTRDLVDRFVEISLLRREDVAFKGIRKAHANGYVKELILFFHVMNMDDKQSSV